VTGEVAEIPWQPHFFSHAISVDRPYYWPDPAAGIKDIFRVLHDGGSAWILINYYRDNPHCHQMGELLAVRTHLLSVTSGLSFSAPQVSPRRPRANRGSFTITGLYESWS